MHDKIVDAVIAVFCLVGAIACMLKGDTTNMLLFLMLLALYEIERKMPCLKDQ
jgi:hypothetical protein